jgi:preprotein translocase subunit SecB
VTEAKTETGPSLSFDKIYVKDASFEAPGAPQVFLEQGASDVQIQLGIHHAAIDRAQGYYEVVLSVTVTAKTGAKAAFLAEVQQAGVFRILGVDDELLEKTLEITAPAVLLPFAREAVSDLIGKGGFPPLLITPVNFDLLYEQKKAAQAAAPAAGHA